MQCLPIYRFNYGKFYLAVIIALDIVVFVVYAFFIESSIIALYSSP